MEQKPKGTTTRKVKAEKAIQPEVKILSPELFVGYKMVLKDPPMPDEPKGYIAEVMAIDGENITISYNKKTFQVNRSDLR